MRQAYREHKAAEAKLRCEILFAHLDGSSLRAIAETVNLSPESVRTIIGEENAKREEARIGLKPGQIPTGIGDPEATRRQLARTWRLPKGGGDDGE